MYSICYVLTDDDNLRYYNELLISISSLKLHMPTINVNIIMDEGTFNIIKNRNDFYKWDNINCVLVKNENISSKKIMSRFIKTSMRKYVSGDFLFLDTDTVICQKIDFVFPKQSISCCLDCNVKLKHRNHYFYEDVYTLNKKYGYDITNYENYYNSGVIFVRDTREAYDFFECWHNEWLKHKVFDQPSFNYIIHNNFSIEVLDNIFNWQVASYLSPISQLSNAVIIHYFHTKDNNCAYLMCDDEICKLPYNHPIIQNIITHPYDAVSAINAIKCDSSMDQFIQSGVFWYEYKIFTHLKFIYKIKLFLIHKMLILYKKLKLLKK